MKWHLREESPNTCSFLENKSIKVPQRKVIYKITSYMERINREWSVSVPCCSTMTSNQTSSWQTESKQRDSFSHKGKGGKTQTMLQGTGGGRGKGFPSFTLTEEPYVREWLTTKCVWLERPLNLKWLELKREFLARSAKFVLSLSSSVSFSSLLEKDFGLAQKRLFMFLCYIK